MSKKSVLQTACSSYKVVTVFH